MTTPFDDTGRTQFSLRAMEKVISSAIASVPGTAAVDAKLAGLAGRAFPRVMAQMDPDTKVVAIDADIAVYWPSPVTDVASAVRTAVSQAVLDFTGFRTTRVNVTVGGAVAGERTSALEVAARRPLAARVPASVTPRELKPVTTSRGVAVRQIATPTPAAVRGVEVPVETAVRSVSLLGDVPVRASGFAPSTQRYESLRPISAAPQQRLRDVHTPPPVAVRPVELPGEFRLQRVETPRPVQPRSIEAPRPVQPRRVTAPQPTALRPVEIRPSADFTRRVDIPRPVPLRAITITPFGEGAHHE
ncbi:Asp23/Gls24 family envelope stress response protein [Corynebacterium sp. MSK218]|uniref:Asp23/Gls24 family envelope stress response protein n=1 Tax=Corynebacterium sp. MSK218 TaxID=3050218 RepID=UPI00254CBFFD|nr:Asp23/Gls24 family envelope stress response protein [Corynebacterium sp. MSK218]MDK8762345.1 Asp23/Gls24 family envelope stress response protein [Corynebacterium sp. MSK218]